MVRGSRPVRVEVYTPERVPSEVWGSESCGEPPVFQHTPRSVTDCPPSEVTVPPLSPKLLSTVETIGVAVVVTVGATGVCMFP